MVRAALRGRAIPLALVSLAFMLPAALAAPLPAPPPVGPLTRTQVETLAGTWGGASPQLKSDAMRELARVPGHAKVKVFFGAECDDSKREVPRFLKIISDHSVAPMAVEFIAVDKNIKQPAALLDANDVRFLPTFVVSRHGREVGRIVVRPPRGLESDLALLLAGKTSGLLSGNDEVIWSYLASPTRARVTSPSGLAPARLDAGRPATRTVNASAVDRIPQALPPP
jgi:hypothetical protein